MLALGVTPSTSTGGGSCEGSTRVSPGPTRFARTASSRACGESGAVLNGSAGFAATAVGRARASAILSAEGEAGAARTCTNRYTVAPSTTATEAERTTARATLLE